MKKTVTFAAAALLAATSLPAIAATEDTTAELTVSDVVAFKTAWGEGIVKIGAIHTEGGDYRAAATDHIENFYAYGERPVLFKPTLAADDQFRGDFDEALSYFVGGEIAEDGGFAIAPYTNVRWESEGIVISGDTAMAMGNYYFMTTEEMEVKVEYTFGIERMDDGDLKFVLHHSSIPFTPS
ncbi:phosphoribosyl-AMP cyclohydrolase [Pseudaestuariivita sp.]|uniref:phosphoribosyl-AMP cyclohydrolase n=1 Tax=Pseudaestuariivita sp. TaxID=2211669 RepID=UPI004059E6A5